MTSVYPFYMLSTPSIHITTRCNTLQQILMISPIAEWLKIRDIFFKLPTRRSRYLADAKILFGIFFLTISSGCQLTMETPYSMGVSRFFFAGYFVAQSNRKKHTNILTFCHIYMYGSMWAINMWSCTKMRWNARKTVIGMLKTRFSMLSKHVHTRDII